jgi:ribonuclease HI
VQDSNSIVYIHTDGACDPNPGTGGWAAVLRYKSHYKELAGGAPHTTNNRMEMTAAIKALEALKQPSRVVLHTDSEYLQKGITQWLPSWKRRNWRRKGGEIKNLDLWQRIDELTEKHHVEWRWVRGHAGDPLNERCDQLATEEVRRLRRN